jgi:hypothetical protein
MKTTGCSLHAKYGTLRGERKRCAGRYEPGVFAAYAYYVALAVRDDQDRAVHREVVRTLQQVHPRLQHRPTAPTHLHAAGDVVDPASR